MKVAPQALPTQAPQATWKTINRLRLIAMWPVVLLVIALCDRPLLDPTQPWWQLGLRLFGLWLMLKGTILRLWAMGILLKHQQLATSGPYAWSRNPLYLGTLAIWVGLLLAAHWLYGLMLVLPFGFYYFALYRRQVAKEEAKLAKVFGEPYRVYLASVPRFWPRLLPWRPAHAEPAPFTFARMMKNRGPELVAAMLLMLAAMDLSAGVLWPVMRGDATFADACAIHYGQWRIFTGAP